jgi:hypothetical protein
MQEPFAPEIYRKRLLIEGYFTRGGVEDGTLLDYFTTITSALRLKIYGEPIVHRTSGEGKPENEGYDAFVPLIASGIYVCVWSQRRFVSVILYTCADFDETLATARTRDFFGMGDTNTLLF